MVSRCKKGEMMNPVIKKLWIAALRSGEYRQGRGWLRTSNDDYCCLGLLCDIATVANVTDAVMVDRGSNPYSYSGESKVLPYEVVDWAEIEEHGSNPRIYLPLSEEARLLTYDAGKHGSYQLAELNDTGLTFDQIADVIEYFL